MQRKATQAPLPFGFPIVQDKNGESQKLATLKHLTLFFPFLPSTIGSVRSGTALKATPKATATPKQAVPTAFNFLIAVVGRCF